MSNTINIGDIEIPLEDFVVSRNAILGITKSGKTYTAKGIAEQLLEKKVPIIVFDAIGVWRYLKVPSSGGKGYQIVVAGGAEPDLPLTPHSAPEIVRAAIRENIPLVIDLYDPKLSKSDWRRIVEESCRILLYENKGLRHILLEESAEYAPQRVVDRNVLAVYAEVEKLARMGGNASLGITFINQRAQELNKAVLELCDNIILLRQRGSHAIDSLEKWMDRLNPDMAAEIARSMPNMTQGDCWVFTENGETPIRTRSKKIKSFHPDRRRPDEKIGSGYAAVNTTNFVAAMKDMLPKLVEEQKANDPFELKKQLAADRKRIGELETQLAQRPKGKTKISKQTEIVNIPALSDYDRQHISKLVLDFQTAEATIREAGKQATTAAREIRATFQRIMKHKFMPQPSRATDKEPVVSASPRTVAPPFVPPMDSGDSSNTGIGGVGQKILNALAELQLLGVDRPVREMVALMSGYTNLRSAGLVKAMGGLRTAGYVDYPDSERILLTSSGMKVAKYPQAPRSSAEIQQRVCSLIGGKGEAILKPLLQAYPHKVSREEVAAAAGYGNLRSAGFVKAVGRLRSLGFIDYPDTSSMVANSILFLK